MLGTARSRMAAKGRALLRDLRRGRRRRQRQGERGEGQGGEAGDREDAAERRVHGRALLPPEKEDERPARRDPPDGAPQADAAELLLGVLQVMEADRVGQGERRHVGQRVDEHDEEERPERALVREGEHGEAAHEVAQGQEAVGPQVTVGDLAAHEERGDRRDGLGGEDPADLGPAEVQGAREVEGEQGQPRAPDHVLQEHHHAEAPGHAVEHADLRSRGIILVLDARASRG